MIVSQNKKLKKNCQKREIFRTKFSKNCLKWLKFTYFVDNTSKCIPHQNFVGKLQLFLTDGQKIMYSRSLFAEFFYQSVGKKIQIFFLLEMS